MHSACINGWTQPSKRLPAKNTHSDVADLCKAIPTIPAMNHLGYTKTDRPFLSMIFLKAGRTSSITAAETVKYTLASAMKAVPLMQTPFHTGCG